MPKVNTVIRRQVYAYVPEKVWRTLRRVADEHRRNMSKEVGIAIDEYLARLDAEKAAGKSA